jgi:hypothetical protein
MQGVAWKRSFGPNCLGLNCICSNRSAPKATAGRSKAKLLRPKLVETQASVADACPENHWPKLLLPKPDSAQSISTGRSKANLHRKRTEVFALILVMPGTRTHHGAFLTFCYVVGPNWRSKAKLPRPKLVETQASVADACPENLWPKLLLPKPDSPADLKQNCAGRGRRCLS